MKKLSLITAVLLTLGVGSATVAMAATTTPSTLASSNLVIPSVSQVVSSIANQSPTLIRDQAAYDAAKAKIAPLYATYNAAVAKAAADRAQITKTGVDPIIAALTSTVKTDRELVASTWKTLVTVAVPGAQQTAVNTALSAYYAASAKLDKDLAALKAAVAQGSPTLIADGKAVSNAKAALDAAQLAVTAAGAKIQADTTALNAKVTADGQVYALAKALVAEKQALDSAIAKYNADLLAGKTSLLAQDASNINYVQAKINTDFQALSARVKAIVVAF